MNDGRPIDGGGVDAAWEAWRVRALNALLVTTCIAGVPMALPAAWGEAGLPTEWRLLGVGLLALALLTTVWTGLGFGLRSWTFLALAYSASGIALANRGLIGYGRLGLAVSPCVFIVLMGPRAGWISAGLSLGIYGAFASLAASGVLRDSGMANEHPLSPGLWFVQGLALAMVVVPSVVLLNFFRVHHIRSVQAERRISRQLQEEIARRSAVHESLNQEHARRTELEERIAQLGEEERRQLGREIHDGICQQLTAALLRSTALQEQLNGRQVPEAAQASRLRVLIQEMLDDAYEISRGMWPVGPEPDGVIPALLALARRTSEEFGLPCEFRQRGEIALKDGQAANHLYHIAQEAVSNAVRHAKASRISVHLDGSDGAIVLNVADDGCGPPDPTKSRGMGLEIMVYRARSMGGTLAITRSEGGGTTVVCTVPCHPAVVSEGVPDAT